MKFLSDIFRVWRRETYLSVTDMGILLFFVVLPLTYPLIYTIIYNPEVPRDIPAVVIDRSHTAESRELIRTIDATPSIQIVGLATDLADARRAWGEKKCYAVFEIPADYATCLARNEQAVISYYQDMSLLLRYRQTLLSLSDVQIHETMAITARRIADNAGLLHTVVDGLPVETQANITGDPTQGFASFVIPGIIVLILQQGLLLGVATLAGTRRDRRQGLIAGGASLEPVEASPAATVIGRTVSHLTLYLPLMLYVLLIVPAIFSLPRIGSAVQFIPLILLMLVAVSFLGQTIQIFVSERETALVIIVFTSVIFLFMSGLTWPLYAFPMFWRVVAALVPATWGVEGFVHINSNDATLHEVALPYLAMLGLSLVYFITAVLATRRSSRS